MSATETPGQTRLVTDLGAERIEREIPNVGTLVFENAEAGQWLTKKGTPAKKAKRTYTLTPAAAGEPAELDAVSSIVGCMHKQALLGWYEKCGAIGAIRAVRAGEIDDTVPEEEVIDRVRLLGLGADRQKSDAADRGTAIHTVFEALAQGGEPPDPAEFPEEARPWLQGAVSAWLALDPEPTEVEQIVCHPDDRYAGRPDLVAHVRGVPTLIDYKTGKGRIYPESQYQTRLYERARRACGQEPCERLLVIGVKDDGGFEVCESAVTDEDAASLLALFRSRREVERWITAQRAVGAAVLNGSGAR